MLSPNEFVVNAASAGANKGLLNQINSGRGKPLYLADGGPVNPLEKWYADHDKKEKERAKASVVANPVPAGGGIAAAGADWQAPVEKEAFDRMGAGRKRLAVADPFGPIPQMHTAGDLKTVRRMQRADVSNSLGYEQSIFRSYSGLPGEEGQIGSATLAVSQQRADNQKIFKERWGRQIAAADAKKERLPMPRVVKPAGRGRMAAAADDWKPWDEDSVFAKRMSEAKARLDKEEQDRINGVTPFQKAMRKAAARLDETGSRHLISVHGGLDPVRGYAAGGLVGGSGDGDTVPAMLTPGEYVLPRNAVQSIGPGRVQHLAQGGLVGGPSGGGAGIDPAAISAMQAFAVAGKDIGAALSGFGRDAGELSHALSGFIQNTSGLTDALKAFPHEVTHTIKTESVVHFNGADVLAGMNDLMKSTMREELRKALDKEFASRMPDAPSGLRSDPTRIS